MAKPLPRVYWDSCVFLAFLNAEEGRKQHVGDVLEDAAAGRLEILTSTATIVEVAWAKHEKDGGRLDVQVEDDIASFWDEGSPVALVEFHDALAVAARELIRYAVSEKWSLKPFDAIHLATAAHYNASAFHTYDVDRLTKYASKIGCAILNPESQNKQMHLHE